MKQIKSVNLSEAAIKIIEAVAKKENRSFSQAIDLLILKSKEDEG